MRPGSTSFAGLATIAAVAAFGAGSAWGQQKPLTANDVVARIKQRVAVEWQANTVDTFKAGDPNEQVTGIAVTMMATMDVLQLAAAAGDNFIITHEPTFYDHHDQPEKQGMRGDDEVYAAKQAFIKAHHLVIWRFHDHWHEMMPDGIEAGTAKALGWQDYEDRRDQYLFTVPQTTVAELATFLREKLQTHAMRVIGNPAMKVEKVALAPGSSGFANEVRALETPGVDVLVTGEPREWETVEYVADAVTQGKNKALIVLGHLPSEQAGMEECARWLKGFVSEAPVQFIPAKDPFWKTQPEQN